MRDAQAVAKRCVVLELLLQRYGLETDPEDSAEERDRVRVAWVSRLADLGVEVLPAEQALLDRRVGELSDEDLDDLHGRAAGALVLLWALGRLFSRPSFTDIDAMESLVLEHGVLGAGSIAAAKATMDAAALRPEAEIDTARATYQRVRGKAREASSADAVVAELGVHHLEWVLFENLPFEE